MTIHAYDGKRQVEDASYEGTVFQCECGEPFVTYEDLVKHIEEGVGNVSIVQR